MDKSIIGLVAAIGAVAPFATAHAAVTPDEAANALRVTSIAELLDPTPNALAVLTTLDSQPEIEANAARGVQLAWHHHHHYHHHHHFYHHHHHHHHYFYHHHHHHYYYHHHHHHHHRYGWCWQDGIYGPFCF